MSSLAIITARGGSKRIPRKNIKDFLGKPILAYSIEAALGSGVFDEVMVSTDDKEIAEIAEKYGAKVPFLRSEATSNDYATTDEVIAEVLEEYKKSGIEFDSFCCIYPTAPLLKSERLKEAMTLLNKHESVTPVTSFSYPPQRGFVINEGILIRKYPEFATARSQDLEKLYHDCGQFYACRTDSFFVNKTTDVDDMAAIVIPEEEVQDIDTLEDWVIAEEKYKRLCDRDINRELRKAHFLDEELKTPYYRIDESALDEDIRMLKMALDSNWSNNICSYSVKTNSLPWLLSHFREKGFYAEVVSGQEYELAKHVGFSADKVIYNGPIKDRKSFEEVLLAGGLVNIDSSYEPLWIKEIAMQHPNRKLSIGVRVNYDLSKDLPEEVLADEEGSRFGYCFENGELKRIIDFLKEIRNVEISGVHLHHSTKTRSVDAYRSLARAAVKIAKEYQLNLRYVDMGGGYYGGVVGKPDFRDYVPAITKELSAYFDKDKTALILEPGVSMVSSSFDFVTEVVDIKDVRDNRYVIIDGSRVNLNPQVTRRWYPHRLQYVSPELKRAKMPGQMVCGSTCMEYDRLFMEEDAEELKPGDRIIFTNAGGYTVSLSPLFIHYYPAVYVKKCDGSLFVAREAWTNEEYLSKNHF